ncbi:MAG: thioredoxin-disulfide reductase [Erysipelotrichaceae bacterium]
MERQYDIIIVGGGPAGLSAALYASRSNASVLIIENGAPGGKLLNTDLIENYPGYTSINGAELALSMLGHATSFNANIISDKVLKINKLINSFNIECDKESYEAKAVIIASGTKPKLMNIPGELEFTSKGVSYCAVCDAPFYRNKEVAVIGGGNSALEEAEFLTRFVSKVHLIVRRDVFRADPIYIDKILANKKVEVYYNSVPMMIKGVNDRVSSLVIKDKDGERDIAISGVFPFVGNSAISEFVNDLDITNEDGYIIVDNDMNTKVKGIYAAGDVIVKNLRQVVTACSDGAIAGQNAVTYINNK